MCSFCVRQEKEFPGRGCMYPGLVQLCVKKKLKYYVLSIISIGVLLNRRTLINLRFADVCSGRLRFGVTLLKFVFLVFAEVEKEKSGSLESVPASLYDSVCVPDLSEYLGDYASSNAPTPNSDTSSTNSSTKSQQSSNSSSNSTNNSDNNQVSSTTKSTGHSVSSNGVLLQDGKYTFCSFKSREERLDFCKYSISSLLDSLTHNVYKICTMHILELHLESS